MGVYAGEGIGFLKLRYGGLLYSLMRFVLLPTVIERP